ncbi:MAG: hypothetical protein C0597_13535 [Marinilabiliales bacterium]|nr:MAG: hypothetical protein C0597_13535 [Marinilabiliales bacterium]
MNTKEVIKNLRSGNQSLILETLDYIKHEGNNDMLNEVIQLLQNTNDTIIRDEIVSILEHVKEQDSVSTIVHSLENADYEDILSLLVSACWKNGLDYSDSVEIFTDIFIKSDFQLAFDAFTVIDNVEEIDNRIADACIFRLRNSIEDIQDDKKSLYFELINIIEDKKENPAV